MISYNDLYELLRKEKYSETLQVLPKNFLSEFSDYVLEKKDVSTVGNDLFADSVARGKKQLENSISLFKELILRRKKKILALVFVAAETGIMKRDYENMLAFEREVFDKIVKAFEEGDKDLSKSINGKKSTDIQKFKLIMFNQDAEQFVDMNGNSVGPFKAGDLSNLDREIADIFVSSGKAKYIDEE